MSIWHFLSQWTKYIQCHFMNCMKLQVVTQSKPAPHFLSCQLIQISQPLNIYSSLGCVWYWWITQLTLAREWIFKCVCLQSPSQLLKPFLKLWDTVWPSLQQTSLNPVTSSPACKSWMGRIKNEVEHDNCWSTLGMLWLIVCSILI